MPGTRVRPSAGPNVDSYAGMHDLSRNSKQSEPDHDVKSCRPLSEPAVAVLVLLAGAAGARLVASDLAPACRILRVALGRPRGAVGMAGTGERGRERRVGEGHLILA